MEFNYKKAIQALNFFAKKEGGVMNKMKALKLLWLAERYHLRHHGRTIIYDEYCAMPYGPVASTTRDILELKTMDEDIIKYRDANIQPEGYDYISKTEVDNIVFSNSDVKALNKIYEKFCNLNQYELKDLTHEYPEWKRWQSKLEDKDVTLKSYPMSYEDFFLDADIPNDFFKDSPELLEIAKVMFEGSKKINALFTK